MALVGFGVYVITNNIPMTPAYKHHRGRVSRAPDPRPPVDGDRDRAMAPPLGAGVLEANVTSESQSQMSPRVGDAPLRLPCILR
jgi:hypothetical protein